MKDMLKDKIALVTGGASGMGEATVRLFAKEGAKVVIGDYNAAKGEALARELSAAGYGVRFYGPMDITKETQIKANVDALIKEFGRIDVFCQYAGGEIGSNFNTDNVHMENWDPTMDRNLKGNFMCYVAIVPYMKKQRSGNIIFCSSNGAMNPPLVTYAYHAAKAGMESVTINAAFELCRYGIRVNCIIPGPIHTPFWDEVFPPEMPQEARTQFLNQLANAEVPLNRLGTADDIAKVALFFASDMSGYVTGLRMFVAGGMGYINCPEGTFMSNSKVKPIPPAEG
ncbi:MAG: SDR family oxidoreductase [Syntrophomonadaceae bacterium]|nr:SDR family oxidoreductase [Syntrophomonadaceae bacterium]